MSNEDKPLKMAYIVQVSVDLHEVQQNGPVGGGDLLHLGRHNLDLQPEDFENQEDLHTVYKILSQVCRKKISESGNSSTSK